MLSKPISARSAALILACAFAAGLIAEAGIFLARAKDPAWVFLTRGRGADWARHPRPMEMALLPLGTDTTGFRHALRVTAQPASAVLNFRALTRVEVMIDQAHVFVEPATPPNWKQWRAVEIAPYLTPGDHMLTIVARNDDGPAFIQVARDGLGLETRGAWEASRDGQTWSAVATADRIEPIPGSRAFPRSDRALASVALWLMPAFLLGALARWYGAGRIGRRGELAGQLGIVAAVAVLGLNAVNRVPVWFGFDVREHMEYIDYIYTNGRLPLATQGFKMNEAPLFHLVSAIPYALLHARLDMDGNILSMRYIPLLCGIAQAIIALRTLRLVFPGEALAQFLGALVCGLLPMNIYLSLYPSNQPFVGVWSALAVYFTLRHILDARDARGWAGPILVGLCLGLATLSKVTGLLAAPGAMLGLAIAAARRPGGRARAIAEPFVVLAILALVSGWYFARNLIELGTPFSVGFDAALGTVWRQDPGFRAPGQLLTFGEGLWYPVMAGFVSFWDSLYSTFWSDGFISSGQVPPGYVYDAAAATRPPSVPPWDFRFLGAATLLSLGPVALILLGTVRALARPRIAADRGTLLCLFWISTHLAGMSYLYLSLPTVSAGKAAYALNVLPCVGVLVAQGVVTIARRPALSAIATGAIAAWACAVYAAFWVK